MLDDATPSFEISESFKIAGREPKPLKQFLLGMLISELTIMSMSASVADIPHLIYTASVL